MFRMENVHVSLPGETFVSPRSKNWAQEWCDVDSKPMLTPSRFVTFASGLQLARFDALLNARALRDVRSLVPLTDDHPELGELPVSKST
jgi:hypothetical protein